MTFTHGSKQSVEQQSHNNNRTSMDFLEINRQKDVPAAFWMFVLDLRQWYGREAEDIARDIWEKGDEKGEDIKKLYKSLRLHMKQVSKLKMFEQANWKSISFNGSPYKIQMNNFSSLSW